MALEITRRDARRIALGGLIDYAGLFPPASLDMAGAVAEYRQARQGREAWMVDRFICPASGLEDLARVLIHTMTADEAPWEIVVTAGATDARVIADFSAELGRAVSVAAVEVRLGPGFGADEVATLLEGLNRMVFFEAPDVADIERMLELLARVRSGAGRALGAKIRCGGSTAEMFPSPATVARFLAGCAAHRLPAKATAGLHHPIRHVDRVTGFHHHGFLNLLAAAALAATGASSAMVEAALADDAAGSFGLDAAGLRWRDRRFDAGALTALREWFVGYGSCSITEPVDDLRALGLLPVTS